MLKKSFETRSSRFIHRTTAATRPLPIESASKTDIVTTLAVYQLDSLICTQINNNATANSKIQNLATLTLSKIPTDKTRYHTTN